ncbi:MAG: phage portal protein [Fimbriimonadaceae bacterium]|nr:phage portal protein [Alphaproteobacteria bacterium]
MEFSGVRQCRPLLLLEGGLDWKSMSLSPRDMDFMEAKHAAARDIALAFGIPPMLLGIPGDNTYTNYQEANRVFWRQTVLPLANRVAKAMTNWLTPIYGDGLTLAFDMDRIEALAQERDSVWRRLRESDFLTVNEKRAAVGYSAVDGGDELPAALRR